MEELPAFVLVTMLQRSVPYSDAPCSSNLRTSTEIRTRVSWTPHAQSCPDPVMNFEPPGFERTLGVPPLKCRLARCRRMGLCAGQRTAALCVLSPAVCVYIRIVISGKWLTPTTQNTPENVHRRLIAGHWARAQHALESLRRSQQTEVHIPAPHNTIYMNMGTWARRHASRALLRRAAARAVFPPALGALGLVHHGDVVEPDALEQAVRSPPQSKSGCVPWSVVAQSSWLAHRPPLSRHQPPMPLPRAQRQTVMDTELGQIVGEQIVREQIVRWAAVQFISSRATA